MKILIIGGTGTIGRAVVDELRERHNLIIAGHTSGEIQVDIKNPTSIAQMYQKVGKIDAVIATVGKVHFGPLQEMTEEKWQVGINDKLLGQVNLVHAAIPFMNDGGSFSLTSGILSDDPIRYGSSAAMVNGAINSFVKASAIELPRGLRINAISPTVIAEAMEAYGDYFHGYQPVAAARVALAYSKSVEGAQTGQIYTVWE